MRKLFGIFCLAMLLCVFNSCTRSEEKTVEKTAKEFYLSYQNMDFNEIVEYCTPLMTERMRSIESGLTPESRKMQLEKLKSFSMTVETVEFNADTTAAVATCSFVQSNTKEKFTDKMELQKISGVWKISEF